MKVLLDECVVQDVRHKLGGHDVYTTGYMGWNNIKNGRLLALAANAGFDAMITTDRAMANQHDPRRLPVAVYIMHGATNDLESVLVLIPELLKVMRTQRNIRQFVHVRT